MLRKYFQKWSLPPTFPAKPGFVRANQEIHIPQCGVHRPKCGWQVPNSDGSSDSDGLKPQRGLEFLEFVDLEINSVGRKFQRVSDKKQPVL